MSTQKDVKEQTTKSKKSAPSGSDHKVFDVAHPGKTMPSSNARPAIITHHALAKDPMISPELDSAATVTDHDSNVSDRPIGFKKIRIEPLHIDDSTETAVDDTALPPSDAEVPEEQEPELADDLDESMPHAEDTSESVVSNEPTNTEDDTDEIADLSVQASAKKVKKSEDAEAEQRQKHAQELIASKKYALSIHSPKRRKRTVAIGSIAGLLFLAVVGAIVAIDAELIDIGIELPFDLL